MGNKNKFKNSNIVVDDLTNDVQDSPETSSIDTNPEVEETEGLAQIITDLESANNIETAEVTDKVTIIEEEPIQNTGRVNCERLNLREDHSTESNIIEVLTKDTIVNVEMDDEVFGDFYKVITNNGTVGFCVKEFIEIL